MTPELALRRRRTRRLLRWLRRLYGVLAWMAVLGFLYVSLPEPVGQARLGVTVVSGNSMVPTYANGDAVVTWRTGGYLPGDPIVYQVPGNEVGSGLAVIHRVTDVRTEGYVTQGDNNDFEDPWRPTDREVQGEVVARIPHGAFLMRWVASPIAMAAACGMLTMFAVLGGRSSGGRHGGARNPPRTPGNGPNGSGGPRGRAGATGPAGRRAGRRQPTGRRTALLATVLVSTTAATTGYAATFGGLAPWDLTAFAQPSGLPADPITLTQTITSDLEFEYCATVTVTNVSTGSVRWQETIDVAASGGNAISSSTGVTTVSFTPTAWEVNGDDANAVLGGGTSTQFQYCATKPDPGYTSLPVLVVSIQPTTAAQYCVNLQVSTTSTTSVRWSGTISHNTPGLTSPKYWLQAQPTNLTGIVSLDFNAGSGTWILGGQGNKRNVVAGAPVSVSYCAPWNSTAPVGATTSTVTITSFSQTQYCASVAVTTTSTDWVRWRSTIDHATPALSSPTYWLGAAPSPTNATTVSFVAATGTWVVSGTASNGYVRSGSGVTWSFCAPTSTASVPGSATATATVTSFGGEQYCATVAVATTATDWVRWEAVIDHTTPGLTATPYWLATAPSPTNAATVSFAAATGTWVLGGTATNAFVKAGSGTSFSFCAPTSRAVLTEGVSTVTVTDHYSGQYCASVTVTTTSTDWIAWKTTIDHTTPGLTAPSYWLSAAPTSLVNVATHSFAAATGSWVARGVAHNGFVKQGSPVTWSFCAPLDTSEGALVAADVSAVVKSSWPTGYCADVTVSTTSSAPIAWKATVDHATPGLTDPAYWLSAAPTNFWNVQQVSFDGTTGTWVLKGAEHNATVQAGAPRTFGYCVGS